MSLAPGAPNPIDLGNPVQWNHPLNRDRKAWWYGLPNYGLARRVSDLTGRADLTTVAGTPWHPGSVTEPYGNALDLNGWSSQFADTSTVYRYATDTTGAVACWVRRGGGGDTTYFCVGRTANSDFYRFGYDSGAGKFQCQLRSGASDTVIARPTTTPATNVWYRVLFVMTASGLRGFVNGREETLTFATGTSSTVTWFGNAGTAVNRAAIGVRLTAALALYWNGQVADAGVWGPDSWACADPVGFAWADYSESRVGYPTALRRFVPKAWAFLGAAGGTTYPESVSGSCTPTGGLTGAVTKALAGSETTTGALVRAAAALLTGSGTATGAVARAASKAAAGTATASGAATNAVATTLSGSETATGELTTQGVTTLSVSGSSTPSGVESHAVAQALAGSIAASGAESHAVAKAVAGSETAAGALARAAAKPLAGSSPPSGALSLLRSALLAASGAATAAGALVRSVAQALAGYVTGSGSLTTEGGGAAALAPGGTFRRSLPTWGRLIRRALPSWSRVWRYNPMSLATEGGDAVVAAASDDRDYCFDCSAAPELATGTGITIASGEILGGSGLTVGSVSVLAAAFDGIAAGKGLSVRVSGGSAGTKYPLACRVTLSNGRQFVVPGKLSKVADYDS